MVRVIRKDQIKPDTIFLPDWTHPEVLYWYYDWKTIRDCMTGEKSIKRERNTYLPALTSQTATEYQTYLDRATFYNFTGRTVNAMTGTLFRRDPIVIGIPPNLETATKRISKYGTDLLTFMKFATQETLAFGRFGVLIDLPQTPTTDPQPYLTAYIAENILDWDIMLMEDPNHPDNGRWLLRKVVLREVRMVPYGATAAIGNNMGSMDIRRYVADYRKLELVQLPDPNTGVLSWVYQQTLYKGTSVDADLKPSSIAPGYPIIPTRRGERLSRLPFRLFGSLTSEPQVEKPPMLDIAQLNLSHFRSYAQLEHGRFYTGMPVFYVEVSTGQDAGEYLLGPSVVWEVPVGSKAGILEFHGQGLKFLENALEQKEAQAAALGGRMVGIVAKTGTESTDETKMKSQNEQATLLNISQVLDRGFTDVLRLWAWWSGADQEEIDGISIEYNKDFLNDTAGAREFRAIHEMYKDGTLPVEVVYDYLLRADVIPAWMDVDEFKALLDSQESFPNRPDFKAWKDGYPNRQSELNQEIAQEGVDIAAIAAGAKADEAATKAAALTHQKAQDKLTASSVNPQEGQISDTQALNAQSQRTKPPTKKAAVGKAKVRAKPVK